MMYKAAWAKTQALTRRRYEKLIKNFHTLEQAWNEVDERSLLQAGFDAQSIEIMLEKKQGIDPPQSQSELETLSAQILCLDDENYPPLLKQVTDAPPFLYARGQKDIFKKSAIAIVGSRKMSSYGKQIAHEWAEQLSRQGIVIVSGLALGIDSEAHESVVKADRTTVAVLGSGLDQISPQTNQRLADSITKQGALISEFAPGTIANEFTFPRRNRIISGLSIATLVIEAGEKSGALITASLALDQNREVFAVPGNIQSQYSKGTNALIAKGEAKLVTSPDEILEELGWQKNSVKEKKRQIQLTEAEQKVYELLEGIPRSVNEIVRSATFQAPELSALLTMMEMKGVVKNVGQGMWVRI